MMLSRKVGFYLVKVLAIFIMSALYFVVGSTLSVFLNRAIPVTNLNELSTPYLMVFLGTVFGCIGVVFYVVRVLIKRMPFFLDGMYGFRYTILREAAGGMIFGYTMYAYLDHLKTMMVELGKRLRSEEKTIEKDLSKKKEVKGSDEEILPSEAGGGSDAEM